MIKLILMRPVLFAVSFALLATISYGRSIKSPHADTGDMPEYLSTAYHLRHHGVFSNSQSRDVPSPQLGREPGYPVFLATVMMFSSLDRFTPDCLKASSLCSDSLYRPAQWANAALIGATGLVLFFTARMLTGSFLAAFLAESYVLLNFTMNKWHYYIMSDDLSLFLVSFSLLTALIALRKKSCRFAALAGLIASSLTLTKAIFLLFIIPSLILAAFTALLRWNWRSLAIVCITILAYTAPIMAWMTRNEAVSGMFRLTDMRGGIALSTREVFLHMSPPQYLASFVYWTRGFGPTLARHLFSNDVIQSFELYDPTGFYLTGQLRYGPWVDRIAESNGLNSFEASRKADHELITMMIGHPFDYAASMFPLIYRGLWIDEFVIIGFPALLILSVLSLRYRDWSMILVCAFGLFNIVAYAALSLNIPRYQMTAIPCLAISASVIANRLILRFKAEQPMGE